MTRIYFIRHGENEDHANAVFCSTRAEDALTEKGRDQAEKVALHLKGKHITNLISSNLPRAKETTAIISKHIGLTPGVEPAFREVEVGGLSGAKADENTWKRWDRVMDAWADGKVKTQFPGGENYLDLWGRMKEALTRLHEENEGSTIAIVSHGGILRATLKDLCPTGNIAWYRSFPIENGAIIAVDLDWIKNRVQGRILRGMLVHWADTDHLK